MNLKRGDNNGHVRKLQAKLGIEVVGNFGPKTEQAVKDFQLKNQLSPTGLVNTETWRKIIGDTPVELLEGYIPLKVLEELPEIIKHFSINTPLRLSHFLGQCMHESAGFSLVRENLNYPAKGLRKTFGKYFHSEELSIIYARKPEKIANRVYANRMGNGNEASGDGWKYRGRGYIQLTGYNNYVAFGKNINEDVTSDPDVVATKYPLLSAAWFFETNKLCLIADRGTDNEVVKDITLKINGGTNGLEDRIENFKLFYEVLG